MEIYLALVLSILLTGCQSQAQAFPVSPFPTKTTTSLKFSFKEQGVIPMAALGLTYQSPDGNRYVEGIGIITNVDPIDYPLKGIPIWLVAVPTQEGSLVFEEEGDTELLEVNALIDARLLMDENGRLSFLSSPTTKHIHGIVGDEFEAASITLDDSVPSPTVIREIIIPNGMVVEGISPIWYDITLNGQREIIATISDASQGARIMIWNESGEIIAQGEPIGLGYRWRHQITVAPFGPNGEIELVDELTPHIGGVVEFFQLKGNQLTLVAQVPGYTSHIINSRNLDMVVAGDFDGDGKVELLVPNQAMNSLSLIQRVLDGAIVEWEISLGAGVSSNLVRVKYTNGILAVGSV